MELLTPRLRLRSWTDADRDPFAAMSLTPAVRAFLASIGSRADADGWIDRQKGHDARWGYCFWAVEERETGRFAGSVGLLNVGYQAHFTPAVELGWRIDPALWGRGYAPEGAAASLRHGFEVLRLAEIVAATAPANANSRRVMEKLGMTHDPADDFDHERAPVGHPLRRQVLYRLTRAAWAAGQDRVANPARPAHRKDSIPSP